MTFFLVLLLFKVQELEALLMEPFQFWEKQKSTTLHLTTSFSRHILDGPVK